jgi:putative CocE/NonD family hydrolase
MPMKIPGRTLSLLTIMAVFIVSCLFIVGCNKMDIVAWYMGIPKPQYKVKVVEGIMIPMRDGVKLAADLYMPDKVGKYPIVLIRTMYGRQNKSHGYDTIARIFTSQGYIFLVQDVRGRFDSEGEFYPYIFEAADGYDTVEWAGTQPWSTGKVGTIGASYWGSTQWLLSPNSSKYLKAMVPINTSQDVYPRWIYYSIFRITDVLAWFYENAPRRGRSIEGIDWNKAVSTLPLIKADESLGENIPAYDDWINHPVPGPYWDRIRVDNRVQQITVPAMIIEGWYDYYLDLALNDFNRMRNEGGSVEAKQSVLMVGPWTHTMKSKFSDADFGKDASFIKQYKLVIDWFDYWLKGKDNGILTKGPVRIFTMGANTWKTENEWPPKNVRYDEYFLHSDGNANGIEGVGSLTKTMPGSENPDGYEYDPADPVPSVGGTSIYGNLKAGPYNQKTVESRRDVLIYTTAPLETDMNITGPVKLIFYASSTAKDTDFAAKLTDVYPDGKSVNLQAAVIRAKYRNSFEKPALLENGKVYRFEMLIGSTSILLKKGHRIRLQLTSSNFPEYGRNLNTGDDNGTTSAMVKASQVIYHDSEHPSKLVLPVIP